MTFAAWMGVLLALLLMFWAVGAYNRLVNLRWRFKAAFAPLEVQLKHRYELVPRLVETAKDSLKEERAMLEELVAAGNDAVTANGMVMQDPGNAAMVRLMDQAETALNVALATLLKSAQANPALQENQNMRQLCEELAATEAAIAFARQAYNAAATDYNHSLAQFPGSVIANMFAFSAGSLLHGRD